MILNMKKSNKTIVVSLILIITLAVISIYNLNTQALFNDNVVVEISALECKPQIQSCKIVTEDFNIEISLNENIFYLKPFNVFVQTEVKTNFDIEFIQIDFKMEGMNMGVNRFLLTKKNNNDKKKVWNGKALLPICVARRADWFAELEIVTKQKQYFLSIPACLSFSRPSTRAMLNQRS